MRKKSMSNKGDQINIDRDSRRNIIRFGLAAFSASVLRAPNTARADARFSQRVSLYNVHTDEKVETTFWDGSHFVAEGVSQIEWLLRDWRTNQVAPIDMRLMLVLRSMAQKMETSSPFHVISGFRSQSTNLMLHDNDPEGVPEQSYHMYGMAIDIRLPEIETAKLRDLALWASNGNGGVGYYPRSDFVHIDTGRLHRKW